MAGLVFPVNELELSFRTDGATTFPVGGLTSVTITFDNGIEEWNPLEAKGWTNRMMTAKSVTLGFSGKRVFGDVGNDNIAALAYTNGNSSNGGVEVTFPNGATLDVSGVINVTDSGGGESTEVAALNFELLSSGKPTFTAPTTRILPTSAKTKGE